MGWLKSLTLAFALTGKIKNYNQLNLYYMYK